jgi:hypothetical protein
MIGGELLRAIVPPSEKPMTSNGVRSSARQNSTQALVSGATVDGVSPEELPIPG